MKKALERSKEPKIILFISTIVLTLTSLIIWLFRLWSKPAMGMDSVPSSTSQVPVKQEAGGLGGANVPVENPAGKKGGNPQQASKPPVQPSPGPILEENTYWTMPTRYIAGVGLMLFYLGVIVYSRQSLSMLIFAALIAILVRPGVQFLQRRFRFSRGLAVMFMYLLAAFLMVAFAVLIGISLAQAFNGLLAYDWENVIQGIVDALNNAALQIATVPLVGKEFASTLDELAKAIQGVGVSPVVVIDPGSSLETLLARSGKTIGVLGSMLGPIISGVVSLFFMMLISLQMSLASGQVRGWVLSLVPNRFTEEIGSLLDQIFFVWTSFLSGQFLLMVVMGMLVWIMNLILGTPQALFLGILAGFLEIIPTLGPIIATIPAAILALLFGSSTFPELTPWIFMLIVIAGYGLMNLLENQILVPRILGGAVNLPPLIVLIGVMIVGAQAGIAGIFLVTPIMATAKLLVEYVYRKINQKQENDSPGGNRPSVMDKVRGFLSRIRLPFRGRKKELGDQPPATTSTEV